MRSTVRYWHFLAATDLGALALGPGRLLGHHQPVDKVVAVGPGQNLGLANRASERAALLLGPLFIRAFDVYDGPSLGIASAVGGTAQLVTQTLKFLWLSRSETFELRASSLLLAGQLRTAFLTRLGLLVGAGIVGPLIAPAGIASAGVLVAALAGEWAGRWLFFVSVVPKNIAASFTKVNTGSARSWRGAVRILGVLHGREGVAPISSSTASTPVLTASASKIDVHR